MILWLILSDKKSKKENLNLADVDLKKFKFSDEDALALSYLTPGLSRRIQKHLLSQLATAPELQNSRGSVERTSSTLPRRFDNCLSHDNRGSKSGLPVKLRDDNRSVSLGYDSDVTYKKPNRATRSVSLREPKAYSKSPDSSLCESLNKNDCTDSFALLSQPSSFSKYSDLSLNKYSPNHKTEIRKPSPKRVSRFLRPDFFDPPKEENALVKEKKEREMETQKVLKEIRDRRKCRLRRERSVSREKSEAIEEEKKDETKQLLNNVSNNIRNLENNVKNIHDYVNVSQPIIDNKIIEESRIIPKKIDETKKSRISRLVRPKSYPTENVDKDKIATVSPEKESKISRLRKGFTRQGSKERDKTTKDDKNHANKIINEEEKGHKNKLLHSIEKKLEKFRSSSTKDPDMLKEKKSGVESTIKRLREQSLPRNLEHCTESGLIKRAVSVEDLTGTKPLQASRKSVTKILGLFKKYEEQDNKIKSVKKKKDIAVNVNESSQKPERPKSLLIDKMKGFQTNNDPKASSKGSKLPITFRRSLNLDNVNVEIPKKDTSNTNLKLDLSKIPQISTSSEDNRNSVVTDDSSTLLSPDDNASNDSWSVGSDYHTQDSLHSPVSPNGHLCSGDESESVSDRIRRKSFYTRFNEKKRTRKPSLTRTYKDLDLYKDINYGKSSNTDQGYDYKRRSSLLPEPKNYSRTSLLLNDYVNVPNRYQTYNAKISRPVASLYSDSEDTTTLDEFLTAAKSRK